MGHPGAELTHQQPKYVAVSAPRPGCRASRAAAGRELAALSLASYTSGNAGSTDLDVFARLCGRSPRQAAELLDLLVASHALTVCRHNRETGEVF
jgi:hypothetical protein